VAEKDGLLGQVRDVFRKIRRDAEQSVQTTGGEQGELLRREWQRLLSAYPSIEMAEA
jgi:hypothetical protein